MTDTPEHQPFADIAGTPGSADTLRQSIMKEIDRLQRFSTRGLLAFSLFLVVSILAWWGFPFLPTPDSIIALLGKPPSSPIISTVLLIYIFSAIILSLSRMTAGVEHHSSFSHVGFLTVFFLFYYFDRSLTDNYWAVFGSGITILGVESYRIWTFCAESVAKNKEDLEYVIRTGRPPPQE